MTMRYRIAHRYTSMRDGNRLGPWAAGAIVDLDPADADWINTDSPGACLPDEPKPEPEEPKVIEPSAVAPEPEPAVESGKAEDGEPQADGGEADGDAKPAAEPKKATRNRAHTPARTRA